MKPIIAAAALLLATLAAAQRPTPQEQRRAKCSELFVLCANKALAGDFGKLKPWQRKGYENGLRRHKVKRCWLTQYYPQEHRDFRRKKDGGNNCRWWAAGCSEKIGRAHV